MNKIGIMGGTFNPIHYGHLFIAEAAYEQLGLNKVLFMPSKNPPHKILEKSILEAQRVDMIQLAIQNNPHFELSTMELKREGLTYTADTLTLLKKKHPDTGYYFIMGTDALFMIPNWRDPQTIFASCTVVAAGRDHVTKEELMEQIIFLKERFHANILQVNMPTIQISSSDIRERIAAGKSFRYYMPDPVFDYIHKHRLYLSDQEEA